MASFNAASMSKLRECHPDIQKVLLEVVKHFDCKILEGSRSAEKQAMLYGTGASKAKAGESAHNYIPSMAVDVAPYPIPTNWGADNRNELEKFRYFAFYVVGVAQGMGIRLRWGGDWDGDMDVLDQSFNDLVHFEIEGWKDKV